MKLNKILILILVLFSQAIVAYAQPADWRPLTHHENKTCDIETPCFVEQKIDQSKYQIFFEIKKQNKKFWLKKITLANIQSKETQAFDDLKGLRGMFPGERYNLFAADINGDGYLDLALEKGRSSYYYWVYNPKSKNFKQLDKKSKTFFSQHRH